MRVLVDKLARLALIWICELGDSRKGGRECYLVLIDKLARLTLIWIPHPLSGGRGSHLAIGE